MKKFLALLAFLGLFIISCSDDDDATDPGGGIPVNPIEYTSGSADLVELCSPWKFPNCGLHRQCLIYRRTSRFFSKYDFRKF